MLECDRLYPEYGFAKHKGYPTAEHFAKLRTHGPCPIHRRSFAPVAQAEPR
jgi:ribonuclease HII